MYLLVYGSMPRVVKLELLYCRCWSVKICPFRVFLAPLIGLELIPASTYC